MQLVLDSDDNSALCKDGCQVCRMQGSSASLHRYQYSNNCWNNTLRVNNRTAEQMEILPDFSVCQFVNYIINQACLCFHLGQYMFREDKYECIEAH